MIHFDQLPTEPPAGGDFPLLPPGRYVAEIEKAEIRKAKESGNEYLNLQLKCTGADGTVGRVFDKIIESDKQLLQYKLSRFVRALPNTLSGTFDLRDLPKIVQGKTVVVAIIIRQQEGYKDSNEVDIFDNEIYSKYQAHPAAAEAPAEGGFDPREVQTTSPTFNPEKEDY